MGAEVISFVGLGIVFVVLSFLGTKKMLDTAVEIGLIDAPNERSSHSENIPKGGGLVFASLFTLFNFYLYLAEPSFKPLVVVLLVSGPALFALGWLDDRLNLSATIRLFCHLLVSVIVLMVLSQGFSNSFTVLFLPNIFWINVLFCILYQTWFINLYNFMDGADGIAAGVGVVAALGLSLLAYLQGAEMLSGLYFILGASISGFLCFNWGPAKVFMGDSGAYFLGVSFVSLSLLGKVLLGVSLYPTIIVFGFFIMDTTYTLMVRLSRGYKPFQPHREFGFHKLIISGWKHSRVALLHILVVIFWLLPLAGLSIIWNELSLVLTVVAYLPLLGFEVYIKAGKG